jgi:hypothetical protein
MSNLLFSEIKKLVQDYDMDRADLELFIDEVFFGEGDFTIGKYRFINENEIDLIMIDELSSDEYMLGCFNSWFIADILNINSDVIEEMQKAEAYTAIGKLIISLGKMRELVEAYASADGYGHHFNSWDGSEDHISFDDTSLDGYYVFRN